MSTMVHFAKILGACWATAMAVYLFVVFRGSFNVVVASYGPSRPAMWVTQTIFWFWPVVPAFLIAGLWEIVHVIRLRIVR